MGGFLAIAGLQEHFDFMASTGPNPKMHTLRGDFGANRISAFGGRATGMIDFNSVSHYAPRC
jgi:hypothetical protein